MICPNCNHDVAITDQNIGALYTCPSCQASYFINFDGQPEYSTASNEEEFPFLENQDLSDLNSDTENEMEAEVVSEQFNEIDQSQDLKQQHDQQLSHEQIADQPLQQNQSFQQMNEMTPDFNAVSAESQFFSDSNPFESPSASNDFSGIASQIADFGNSETQISALNYDLEVSGLDTREDLLLFKEAIEDSRFGWDASDLMKQIKNGKISFLKLNPVQAYVLAKRIHFLDLEVKWTQHAFQ